MEAPPPFSYPDSVDSSPRSWSDTVDPFPSPKLRLMCSYGGRIVPRPHDKSLCYVGGDTRIVVVDRHRTSLSLLSSRLSSSFLHNQPFTLKYQLPTEDLDSLISVTTDDDFDNMLDEYDRTNNHTNNNNNNNTSSVSKPSRIRLFLFPVNNNETASSSVIDGSVKSEDWFLSALNGTGVVNSNRGFSESESGSVNCLLGLDDNNNGGGGLESEVVVGASASSAGVSASASASAVHFVKQGGQQDVQSVPDSPIMMETTSSFGSTSSSPPSLANLPPIRVHVVDDRVQEQKVVVGIEEQFAQLGVGMQRQEEGFGVLSSPSPPPPAVVPISSPAVVSVGEYPNRVFSDDERSDHGVPLGYRKQTTQSQPPQFQHKTAAVVDLPSPDSVSRVY